LSKYKNHSWFNTSNYLRQKDAEAKKTIADAELMVKLNIGIYQCMKNKNLE
jgi:hypothetical protein